MKKGKSLVKKMSRKKILMLKNTVNVKLRYVKQKPMIRHLTFKRKHLKLINKILVKNQRIRKYLNATFVHTKQNQKMASKSTRQRNIV